MENDIIKSNGKFNYRNPELQWALRSEKNLAEFIQKWKHQKATK